MTKVKLSLPSGSEVEKPVISYFSNGGNYLVLDAESVGSMGLPIILVSKINDNKAEKIIDQNEWSQVKGYLKGIISGGPATYLAAPDSIPADETYYTQLTLPVASFDALKNAYAPAEETPAEEAVEEAPAPEETNPEIAPEGETTPEVAPAVTETPDANAMQPVNMSTEEPQAAPVIDEAPAVEDQAIVNPIIGEEAIANEGLTAEEAPVIEETTAPAVEETPAADDVITPFAPETPAEEAPVIEEPTPVEETPAVEEIPPVEEAPVVENIPTETTEEPAPIEEPVEAPVVEEAPVIEEPVAPAPETTTEEAPVAEAPAITEEIVAPVAPTSEAGNIEEIKAKFMNVCEELFDYLASLK